MRFLGSRWRSATKRMIHYFIWSKTAKFCFGPPSATLEISTSARWKNKNRKNRYFLPILGALLYGVIILTWNTKKTPNWKKWVLLIEKVSKTKFFVIETKTDHLNADGSISPIPRKTQFSHSHFSLNPLVFYHIMYFLTFFRKSLTSKRSRIASFAFFHLNPTYVMWLKYLCRIFEGKKTHFQQNLNNFMKIVQKIWTIFIRLFKNGIFFIFLQILEVLIVLSPKFRFHPKIIKNHDFMTVWSQKLEKFTSKR